MIDVRIYDSAAIRSKSKRTRFTLSYQPGMTGIDLLSSEFEHKDIESVILMVNDTIVSNKVILNDGDTVRIMFPLGGG